MDQEVTSNSLIGMSLREAREAQKMTIEDVSTQLRLSDKQIAALEEDNFDVFGSAMLTRGFIKNYAKLLKLDPEPLLEAHRHIAPQDQAQSIAYKADGLVASESMSHKKSKILILVGALVFCLLAWVIYQKVLTPQKTSPSDTVQPLAEATSSTIPPAPEVALPAAERVDDATAANAVTEIQLPKASAADAQPAQTTEAKKTDPKTSAVEVPAAQDTTSNSASTSGMLRVKLVLTGASWIGVQDRTGKTVFSKLAKAGTEEYVDGLPPLKFHIGNVSATQVILNGEAVDLSHNTYNNMARITLGDH